jgi:hypothetical protein
VYTRFGHSGTAGNYKLRYGTLRQIDRKQLLLFQHNPVDLCPKAEPGEQRSLTLYTFASRLQKQKTKLKPLVGSCDFIGYFISPVLCDLHVSIL